MTLNTTTTHLATLQSFIAQLNEAAQEILKASRVYHRVACLVTYWSDSDQCHLKTQGENLWDTFKHLYGFEADEKPFEIPSIQPYRHLSKAVDDIVFKGGISSENHTNLFILYYGGHATERALWQPKVKSKVDLDWGSCQNLLTEAECDVLFLFDCCYGGAMVDSRRSWKRRCETLCSAPPSHEASGKEDESFTKALVGELQNEHRAHRGCDIITLHSILNSTRSRDTYNLTQDPWFWMPFSVTRDRPGIVLHSMKGDENAPHLTLAERQSLSDARMLFTIEFANPQDQPLLEEWKDFLRNRPSNVLDLKFSAHTESGTSSTAPALNSQQAETNGVILSQTKLHAAFESHSNTAIMSVPLWMWTLLEPHPAIKAVSVVRSFNLLEPEALDTTPTNACRPVEEPIHNGTPRGKEETIHCISTYVTVPDGRDPTPTAVIVFITDIFGVKLINNKLLADKYAADTGCRVLLPDIVPGGGAPLALTDLIDTINTPPVPWYSVIGQVRRAFASLQAIRIMLPLLVQTPSIVPEILRYARAVKADLPADGRLGVAGFCWGGYQSIMLSKQPTVDGGDTPLVDAHFLAHPSSFDIQGSLVAAASRFHVPISIAIGDKDVIVPQTSLPSLKEAITMAYNKDSDLYEIVVYEGCTHGFAVRPDPKQEIEKKGAEEAAAQAQRWFRKHLKLDELASGSQRV